MEKLPVLEVRGLRKTFQDFEAVKGVDFTVYQGDIFGFLGPNGAGKSTTLRMVTSLINPSSGDIRLFGLPLSTNREHILSRMGILVEKPDLYGFLSGYENLSMLSSLNGKRASRQRIEEVINMVGLQGREQDKVRKYSQGMRQRLGIAQALIHDPEIIILDEPSNGLDPQGIVDIRELIIRLGRDYKKTIILSSHLLNEVEMMANRMVIINKGQVTVEGEVQELLGGSTIKLTLSCSHPEQAHKIASEITSEVRIIDRQLVLEIPRESVGKLVSNLVANQIEVYAVVPVRKLEDYFISLT
ncbi:MAG: ABC transporter ATP-binding protein [Bacteroidota bacterium]|jgi:ABC-type multidrug transport system ATPase subunit